MSVSRASLRRVNVIPGLPADAQRAIAELETHTERGVRELESKKSDAFSATPPKTADYAAKIGELVLCDPSKAAFTVTLPRLRPADAGRHVAVKNVTVSLNVITVLASAGQSVDNVDGYAINGPYDAVWLVADGANWWRIGA